MAVARRREGVLEEYRSTGFPRVSEKNKKMSFTRLVMLAAVSAED